MAESDKSYGFCHRGTDIFPTPCRLAGRLIHKVFFFFPLFSSHLHITGTVTDTNRRFICQVFFHQMCIRDRSYVTNSNEGEGLLFYGNVIIPFVDRFPKNSLYKIMTTRLEERCV